MTLEKIKIGLYGFGCVGQGISALLLETPELQAEIMKIGIRDKNKGRSLPKHYFTWQKEAILHDDNINVIVEAIDDADAAFEIVKAALKSRKAVITANKKMIADHLEELLKLQAEYGTPLLYESACCASIPIVRTLDGYYDNELLCGLSGIFNGTSNYILTQQLENGLSYEVALRGAQQKGFAEADPFLDVSGSDACYKLLIIIAHAFGLILKPSDIYCRGICSISEVDVRYAQKNGYVIKLIAAVSKIKDNKLLAYVSPQFVREEDFLARISNEYNGVMVESLLAGQQCFMGKGAGSYPTALAILSDISALRQGYRYGYQKFKKGNRLSLSADISLPIYLRFANSVSIDLKSLQVEDMYQNRQETILTGKIQLSELKKIENHPEICAILF